MVHAPVDRMRNNLTRNTMALPSILNIRRRDLEVTTRTLFRRRIQAAQSDAELLINDPGLEPDERIRLERSLNTLRAVQNMDWLLVVPIDVEKMLAAAELDIIKLVAKIHQSSLPLPSEP